MLVVHVDEKQKWTQGVAYETPDLTVMVGEDVFSIHRDCLRFVRNDEIELIT